MVTGCSTPDAASLQPTMLITAARQMIVSTAASRSVVRRPGRAATMPMVCGDIGGEPYADECDIRWLSGHALD
jgi:hypothetical protein